MTETDWLIILGGFLVTWYVFLRLYDRVLKELMAFQRECIRLFRELGAAEEEENPDEQDRS